MFQYVLEIKKKELSLLVVKVDSVRFCPMLLGRNWIEELNISFQCVNKLTINKKIETDDFVSESKKNFSFFSQGNGKYKGAKVDIALEDNPTPIFCKAKPVPYSLRSTVCEELNRLEKLNILEKVSHSKWASPIVVIEKGTGEHKKVRICGDYKVSINPVSRTEHYPLPNPSDILASVRKGKVFTLIDLQNAYQQLELSEKAQELVTINTIQGLYRFKMMPFGITSAPAIFQATMDRVLFGLNNVCCYIDDILVWDEELDLCKKKVEIVLKKLSDAGLKICFEKCSFFKSSVNYLGYTVDSEGIRPTEKGILAIRMAPKPHNLTTLRAFLGLINFYGRFIPNMSSLLRPLHELLQKNQNWIWTKECNECFMKCKSLLIEGSNILTYYDPSKPIILTCDASQYGLGAVLAHDIDRVQKPICFASRTLNKAEKGYSQLEKEALSIIFGIKHFHLYLYGRKFLINSDHRPLETILNPKKGIPTLAAARIQRWALLLSSYTYDIKYVKGLDIAHADALSRLPLEISEEESAADINYFSCVEEKPLCAIDIAKHTHEDVILSQIKEFVLNGWPNYNNNKLFSPFWVRRFELSIDKDCLLWGRRVIIPKSLQTKMLNLLHEQHPGMVRSKILAKSIVWWPCLDNDLEKIVKNCRICQKSGNSKTEPHVKWPTCSRIFERIHIDFAIKNGNNFLLIIDAFSKWADIKYMPSTTSSATIQELRTIFANFGIPEKIVSDNGPQFISDEFETFCIKNGINHVKTPPYHAKSNGAAERLVQILKQALLKISLENKNVPIQHELDNILFAYRNTPQTVTNKTPSELFLNRKPRTRLTMLKQDLKLTDNEFKNVISFNKGDIVYVKTKRGEDEKWIEGTILENVSNYTYLVESNGKNTLVHVDDLKDNYSHKKTRETPIKNNDSLNEKPFPLNENKLGHDEPKVVTEFNKIQRSSINDAIGDCNEDISETSKEIQSSILVQTNTETPVLRRSSRHVRPPVKLDL